MKQKNNYIIRFDSRELAEKCSRYFPVKSIYSGGFTIIFTGATDNEWKIYRQVIELLRFMKMNIVTNNY